MLFLTKKTFGNSVMFSVGFLYPPVGYLLEKILKNKMNHCENIIKMYNIVKNTKFYVV